MSYYIKGDPERGKEVIAALEEKGGVNKFGHTGTLDALFCIGVDNVIIAIGKDKEGTVSALCKKLTLVDAGWQPKRGELVLVRDDNDYLWREAIFSFYEPHCQFPYNTLGGEHWKQCVQFDIDKLGKV